MPIVNAKFRPNVPPSFRDEMCKRKDMMNLCNKDPLYITSMRVYKTEEL
jgi:hypothetical protein